MTPEAQALVELAGRVERAGGMNNELDVLVEIALFEPDGDWLPIRANASGTKTICTGHDGRDVTFWARDYTISPKQREATYAALRARALSLIEATHGEANNPKGTANGRG